MRNSLFEQLRTTLKLYHESAANITMTMPCGDSTYGLMFAEMLQWNIRSAFTSTKRTCNHGAPFPFGEQHVRKAAKSFSCPFDWPRLIVERKILGDFKDDDKQHGGVDYFFAANASSELWHLSDILATCEVKGPTRKAFLAGSEKNWYRSIVADVRKQLWRANEAPAGEHYLGLMIQPRPGSATREEFLPIIASILEKVPNADLIETSWAELPDVEKLNVVVLRVLPKIRGAQKNIEGLGHQHVRIAGRNREADCVDIAV